jgi:hypothetical protein
MNFSTQHDDDKGLYRRRKDKNEKFNPPLSCCGAREVGVMFFLLLVFTKKG